MSNLRLILPSYISPERTRSTGSQCKGTILLPDPHTSCSYWIYFLEMTIWHWIDKWLYGLIFLCETSPPRWISTPDCHGMIVQWAAPSFFCRNAGCCMLETLRGDMSNLRRAAKTKYLFYYLYSEILLYVTIMCVTPTNNSLCLMVMRHDYCRNV